MNAAERQELREWHIAQIGFHRLDEVEMCQCGTFKWPCDTIIVLDALEEALRELKFERDIHAPRPQAPYLPQHFPGDYDL